MKLLYVFFLLYPAALAQDARDELLQGKILNLENCFKQRSGTTCSSPEPSGSGGNTDCDSRSYPIVHYYLFNSRSKKDSEFLHDCGGRLPRDSIYDAEAETEIFVHGWADGPCRTAVWREMRDELFKRGNYNVIFVEWTKLNFPDIRTAQNALHTVANRTACMIKNIMKQKKVNGDKIHLIGHSFGGHIVGFIGKLVPGIRRITSLDPGGVGGLATFSPEKRLAPSDAKLVDVIHAGGGCFPDVGRVLPLGMVDFYPNGGSVQLSCVPTTIHAFLKLDFFRALFGLLPSFCSHLQVLQYYKVSINAGNCQFVGVECDSYTDFETGSCNSCNPDGSNCAVMGMDWEKYYIPRDNKNHSYYLQTSLKCPYCDNSKIKLNGFPGNTEKKVPPGANYFPKGKI